MFHNIVQPCNSSFPVGLVESVDWLIGLAESDVCPYLAFPDLTCNIQDTGIGVFWLRCANSQQGDQTWNQRPRRFFKNIGVVLVPCNQYKCVPTASFGGYSRSPEVSFVTTDDFSVRVKIFFTDRCLVISRPTYLFLYFPFFNCYFAAPRPTFCHYRGGSLTQPMLITGYLHVQPVAWFAKGLGPYVWPNAQWSLNWEPSNSDYNALTHWVTLPIF